MKDDLLKLAERCEHGRTQGGDWCFDNLNRAIHEIDPRSNVNGTCADYLGDLIAAKRLIPKNHCFSICSDVHQVRAVVGVFLTERDGGFSAVPHGPNAELRALVAAALRARAAMENGDG